MKHGKIRVGMMALLSSVAAVAIGVVPAHGDVPVIAVKAKSSAPKQQNTNNSNSNNSKNNNKANTSSNANSANAAAITQTEADITKDQQVLDDLTRKLWDQFAASADWTNAQTAITQAQAAYDAACQPVLDGLAQNTEYQEALAKKAKAEKDLDALRASDSATSDQVTALATESLEAGQTSSRIKEQAFAANPAVATAKAQLVAASAAAVNLKAKFQASLADNTEWATAKKTLDAAQDKLSKLEGNPPPSTRPATPAV